jgi:GT2 family glycosyltransferase
VQSDALQQLLTAANDVNNESIGIFAASLINQDGSAQSQGGDLPTLTSLFVFAFLLDDLPLVGKLLPSHQHTGRRFDPPSDLTLENKGWVAGTAMLIRSALVPQIGLLDEDIFMYGEDLEYCWRARDAGRECAIVPTAKIIHLGSKSSSNARALEGELISLKYVLAKHKPKWQVPIAQWLLKCAARNRQVLFKVLGDNVKSNTYRSILHRL